MTAFHYSIFLACLIFLNITVLYTYFLTSESKVFDRIHNENVLLTLKYAYLIQSATLLAGGCALYYFTPDKTWFSEIKFSYFMGLAVFCGIAGLINDDRKAGLIFRSVLELTAITGFVFLMPEKEWMTKFSLPAEIGRLLTGVIWFSVYKFICVLCDRFEGILVIQSLHIGFISLILFYFSGFIVSFLQVMGMLFPVMLMLAPLYCLFHYKLPLPDYVKNVFCLMITGFVFFTVPINALGLGALMISYVLFEMTVVFLRFIFNPLKKQKLFFCECLAEKIPSHRFLVSFVVRYNVLISGFVFMAVYLNTQIQFVVLSGILYAKLYLAAIEGETSNGGIIDLIKGAKETAQTGYKETAKTFSELKSQYARKQAQKKDSSRNEQP